MLRLPDRGSFSHGSPHNFGAYPPLASARRARYGSPMSDGVCGMGKAILRWVVLSTILLLLYVLSVGPASRMCEKGVLQEPLKVYAPIIIASRHCRPVFRFLDWYVGQLWHSQAPYVEYP